MKNDKILKLKTKLNIFTGNIIIIIEIDKKTLPHHKNINYESLIKNHNDSIRKITGTKATIYFNFILTR